MACRDIVAASLSKQSDFPSEEGLGLGVKSLLKSPPQFIELNRFWKEETLGN